MRSPFLSSHINPEPDVPAVALTFEITTLSRSSSHRLLSFLGSLFWRQSDSIFVRLRFARRRGRDLRWLLVSSMHTRSIFRGFFLFVLDQRVCAWNGHGSWSSLAFPTDCS